MDIEIAPQEQAPAHVKIIEYINKPAVKNSIIITMNLRKDIPVSANNKRKRDEMIEETDPIFIGRVIEKESEESLQEVQEEYSEEILKNQNLEEKGPKHKKLNEVQLKIIEKEAKELLVVSQEALPEDWDNYAKVIAEKVGRLPANMRSAFKKFQAETKNQEIKTVYSNLSKAAKRIAARTHRLKPKEEKHDTHLTPDQVKTIKERVEEFNRKGILLTSKNSQEYIIQIAHEIGCPPQKLRTRMPMLSVEESNEELSEMYKILGKAASAIEAKLRRTGKASEPALKRQRTD